MNRFKKILLPTVIISIITSVFFIALPAFAQSVTIDVGNTDGDGSYAGRIVQMVAMITVLSLAPSILMMMTGFTRIVVVLSFLRSAMGVQQTPPNPVIIGLALFLTLFVMMPTFQASYKLGIEPMISEHVEPMEGMENAVKPFKDFMLSHVRGKDLELFANLGNLPEKDRVQPETIPLHIIIPSFMISELRRAFEIGFLLFLPFLIIDMVVASILMSMGMMMLPPIMISLPFKIIFFVMVDGWYLISGSLVQSFGGATLEAAKGITAGG